jgi:hypothetical protein
MTMLKFWLHWLTQGDFAKTLISTLLGFVAGVLSEPVKSRLTQQRKLAETRDALYRDIARFYHVATRCRASLELWDFLPRDPNRQQFIDDALYFINGLNTDIYDYYYNSDRATFYRLPDAGAIRTTYEGIKQCLLRCAQADDHIEKIKELIKVVDIMDDAAKFRGLDPNKIKRMNEQFHDIAYDLSRTIPQRTGLKYWED